MLYKPLTHLQQQLLLDPSSLLMVMEVGYRCLPVVVVVYDISLSLHEGSALLWLPRELEEVGWIQVEDGEQHVLVWDSDVL